ncbi:MAG: hypothetical protein PHO70_05910 [Candidatus Omnitrophica bacterium]|nr:hypothetical protein [Candidatus Omnitrophota bacterium]
MIDTIVLTLPPELFAITEHNRFDPSTKGLFERPYYTLGGRGNFSCFQNPTKEEFEKGIYKPRLTATKRMGKGAFITTLKIEFSIPKLLFGNNFDEVEEHHFDKIVNLLQKRLQEMGVLVFEHVLKSAPVSAVHYSKNIALTDYSTPSAILKELSKINLNQKLDLNQTDFRNEGHSLKFRANYFEISLYDKLKDLKKAKTSEKRAIERDNALQLTLFDDLKPKKPFEVLRMEIRLNNRVKIKQVFKTLNISCEIIFSSLFKKDISQKILLSYLNEIKNGYSLLAYKPKTMKDFIIDFRMQNPKVKIRKMLQVLGLKMACNDMGIREFRKSTEFYGDYSWYRLKKDLTAYKYPKRQLSVIKPIEKALLDFTPLRLADFEEKKQTT